MHPRFHMFLVTALLVSGAQSRCLFGDPDRCSFPCRCGGDGLCDSRTGQCFEGQCLTGHAALDDEEDAQPDREVEAKWAWQGPACQIGNVALGKKAISNDHSVVMGEWAELNAMTDGITHSSTRTCPVIWTMTSKPAAWLIDLEVPHLVSGFTLYLFSKSVGKVKVTVGNTTALSEHTTCALLKSNKGLRRKLYAELNCSTQLIGRYVSVVKNPDMDDFPDSLELCEVAVTGHIHIDVDWTQCMDKTFNEIWCVQCQNSLPPACRESCPLGKYGLNCQLSCEPCDGPCDSQSGKCSGEEADAALSTDKPEVTEVTTDAKGIHAVVFSSHDTDQMDDYATGSSTDLWDHTDIESMVSIHVEDEQEVHTNIITLKPKQCVEGYFGENCSTLCGMCFKREYCDMSTGRCPDGCEDWYISVQHECDMAIPRIDLTEQNIRVTSLVDGFKVQLVDTAAIEPHLTEHYKGELRYFPNDGSHEINVQRYMLNFYPTNGSFQNELVIDSLKANTNYEISVAIFRTLDGRINSGSSASIAITTSKVKALPRHQSGMDTSHYSFIVMLTVLVTLILCVAGTLIFLCMRAKKRKSLDDSQTETESSSEFYKETPVYLTKTEPDPIYQFIDDGGETRYHLYHDINDFSQEKSQNFTNNNALKVFGTNALGRDGLLRNNRRTRSSYAPEMNELSEFRPPQCFNNEKLNHGYLTTASLQQANFVTNKWDSQGQPTSAEPPRYIKASQQGTMAHQYIPPANLHLTHQPPGESDYLMPRTASRQAANQIQDYMTPVTRYTPATGRNPINTSGYIPMDSPTEDRHGSGYRSTGVEGQDRRTDWDQHDAAYNDSNSEESGVECVEHPAYQSYVHMA